MAIQYIFNPFTGNFDAINTSTAPVPTTFSFANNQSSFADVTGFLVTSLTAFTADVSISRIGTNSTITDAEDTAFYTNLGTAFNGQVLTTAIQTNQQILVGGGFSTFNGNTRDFLVRLNTDGTEDTAFYTNLGSAFSGFVYSIAVQSNGQILVGGNFNTFNGNTRNYLVRLNSDGTEDTTFATNLGSGFAPTGGNSIVYAIIVEASGQILVGGSFTSFNGNSRGGLVRLNSDGTEDTTFATNIGAGVTGSSASVYSILEQSTSNAIIIGGDFTSFNGGSQGELIGLNSDGTLNSTFNTNIGTGPGAPVQCMIEQANGQVVIGGQFTSFGSYSPGYIIRLNASGIVDTSFQPLTPSTGYDNTVYSLGIQSDQKIIVGGAFTTLNDGSGSVTQNRISRLTTAGLQDVAFYTSFGTGFNNIARTISVQSNDQIIIGGTFTTENSNTRNRLVRWETVSSNAFSASMVFSINGAFNNSAWSIALSDTIGIAPGISFQMLSSGQLQYESTGLSTQTSGVITFLITEL